MNNREAPLLIQSESGSDHSIVDMKPKPLNFIEIDTIQSDDSESICEEKEPTEPSDCSDIPSEHHEGETYRKYLRRYALKLITVTQQGDAHGLYDFEKRLDSRQQFLIQESCNLVRKDEKCLTVDPSVQIKQKFNNKGQLLMTLNQVRSGFALKTPLSYLLKHAKTARERDILLNKQIESYYSESGAQILPPYEMCERLHLVVRSILN